MIGARMTGVRARKSLLCWLALSPLLAVIVFPFAIMFFTALKPRDEVFVYPARWLPSQFEWQNFADLWQADHFATALYNSLAVSIAATLLTIALATPAAYAVARFRFAGRDGYRRFLLATQMISPILLIVGLFRLAAAVPFGDGSLVDTRLGVILVYAAFNLAFAVWILSAYFATIPRDLEEAAWLEGCGRARAVAKVFLPLATPALAIAAIFTFINAWNEFAVAQALLRSADTRTLPLHITDLVAGRYTVDWHQVMAATLLATLPVAVVFAWLQRYLVQGLALGAVK